MEHDQNEDVAPLLQWHVIFSANNSAIFPQGPGFDY
jgi:hypothetical protein